MSNAKTPVKVLKVGLNRLHKGWTKMKWSQKNKQTGVTMVCIEGAIFGYKSDTTNPACTMAKDLVLQVIKEQHPGKYMSIPSFNDAPETTMEDVEKVMKTAIIRAETGGLLKETEEECYEPTKKWL